MNTRFNGRGAGLRFALLAGAASVALPSAAFAQDVDQASDEDDLEMAQPADGDEFGAQQDVATGNRIVITASKREQTLQDTPISVSVTTAETLERAEIRDLIDLQTVTPSLRVSQLQSSANTTFIIRGFGNGANNFGIEPSVGVFIDGVYRSRSAGQISDLANVSRIEVLRGPQSTLFGKNASAGVISVVTQAPQFEFGGSVSATYGNYDQFIVKGDVTGPITDTVAFAIDGSYNTRDGYVEAVGLGENINDRDRYSVRGQLLWEPDAVSSARLIADYGKIDELCCYVGTVQAGPTTPLLFALGGATNTGPDSIYDDRTFLNRLPENEVENYGVSLQLDTEFGPFSVTSITAYRELRSRNEQDVDFTSVDVVNELRDQSVDTFTSELRLTGEFGPLSVLLGGFLFDEKIRQVSGLTTGTQSRPFFDLLAGGGVPGTLSGVEFALGLPQNSIFAPGPLTDEFFALDNEAYSIFGTFDYEVFEGVTLTAGFNYTDDKKNFTLSQASYDPLAQINVVDAFIIGATGGAINSPTAFRSLPAANRAALIAAATNPAINPLLGLTALQFQPPFLNLPNSVEPGRTADDDFSYTLRLSADLYEGLNGYITYATGFKASSVNLSRDSRPSAADFTPGPGRSLIAAPDSPIFNAGLAVPNLTTGSRFAGPENAEVYEIGLKGVYPGISFNLALFDQTIEGFQSFAFTGTGFALANAGVQSTKGIEFDMTLTPTDNLVLTMATTVLDANYDEFTGSAVGDLSGSTPAGIPELTFAASAMYTIDLGSSGNRLIPRVDYYHESDTQILDGLPDFADPTAADPFASARAAATQFTREVNQVNASLTFAMDNGFELSAWARNLTNDRYLTTIFPGVAQSRTVSGYPNAPRTYGATARFRF
ncbi:TonB-dependent receptor [Blastomonas marina]|uniref:TonB-dependent receptor n=1 Tax=Blastomonas marina TaxID=1867408 RepID=A0ABQ1FDE6_9SPHN|nr:TonB-dependent receptor [Blastomonas marina]GGA07923.1 TonB-dependent receptor [Blastomonas marina]